MRCIALVVLGSLAAWANADCTDQDIAGGRGDPGEHAGATIASVRVRSLPVFNLSDPAEDRWLYRWLNRFHINTRPHVIRSQLLFAPGDLLDPDQLAESERLLRTMRYLGGAQVVVDEVCGDEVAVAVFTRDIWTTEPEFSVGVAGGESKQGLTLSEDNVAGTGNALSVGYRKDPDREAWMVDFASPHLFNTRVNLNLGFASFSDGEQYYLNLQQPFYSLRTRYAMGVSISDIKLAQIIRYREAELGQYDHRAELAELFVGTALHISRNTTHRLLAGFTREVHSFDADLDSPFAFTPDNFEDQYPWLEYQYLENEYAIYRNFNLLHRVEDVAVGANVRWRLGYGGASFGNDEDVVRSELEYTNAVRLGAVQVVEIEVGAHVRHYPGASDQSEHWQSLDVGYHFLQGDKRRWFAGLRFDYGDNLLPHREFTTDQALGLRGYPLDYQRGDRRYLISLEKRYITDWHLLNLLRVGTAVYFDIGRAWSGRYADNGHLANFGLGLRLSSSKARIGNVVHVDVAFPLIERDQVDSFQWVLTAANSF